MSNNSVSENMALHDDEIMVQLVASFLEQPRFDGIETNYTKILDLILESQNSRSPVR